MALTTSQALGYINSFDDPYLAAIRDKGQQTWGLDRIRAVLAKLGDPHLAYPTIHIAGTKGKGSTAAFITQGLIESGLKTGLYISPHLEDWRERLQINRELIGEEALARLVEDYQTLAGEDRSVSAFEVTTALAFWHFARQGCEAAVIEVGLGGRLDATSVVEPLVSVITSISLDHMQFLGDTLAQIAGEKAAIIKPGVPVISAPQAPEALAVIEERAASNASPLIVIGRDWQIQPVSLTWEGTIARIGPTAQLEDVQIGLLGHFQVENAALAMAALSAAQAAGLLITREAMIRGLATTRWPGRLERISIDPLVVIDSAHNPYSIGELVRALGMLGGYESLTFVFGCMADKQTDGMLAALLPAARRVIFTHAGHTRAADPEDLLSQASAMSTQAELHAAPDLPTALQMALTSLTPNEGVCVAGSLALAGEARQILAKTGR